MLTTRRRFLMAASSAVLAGCGSAFTAQSPSKTLLVSAAASLQDVMQELEPDARRHLQHMGYPQVSLTFNFGGSGTLQRQIEQGAPTDVFVSAAERQIDALQAAGLLQENSRRTVARNRLALIAPTSSRGLEVGTFQELATDRVRTVAVAQPDTVPAGQYARDVLAHLNLLEPLVNKLVFGRDVRQVLSYVDTGNVDAGLVYVTDAALSQRVRVVAIADEFWHAPIRYPAAAIAYSQHPDLAQAFVEFLTSSPALAVFESYGFQAP